MALTLEHLAKSNRQVKRRKGESTEHYLQRLTHVSVICQKIAQIKHLDYCPSITSLYLYDNVITRLENLSSCTRITALYLQHNRIGRIECLDRLRWLSKLHLGYNCIGVLEGLESLSYLRELHVEHQSLPPGQQLYFDPRSIRTIAPTLRILNICGNGIESLEDLAPLQSLTLLDVAHNAISDLSDVMGMVAHNPFLSSLSVAGNPLCAVNKHREEARYPACLAICSELQPIIIVTARDLVVLDGKEVPPAMRQFLQRWKLALDSRREHSAPMNRSEGPPPSRPPLSAPLLGPSSGPGLVPTRPPAAASFSPSATRGPRLLPPIFRSRMPSELGAGLAAP